ncbi:MAG: DHH family phosphoesterase [Promethearchaeota archaeon]
MSAASIIASTLLRAGVTFQVSIQKQVTLEGVEWIKATSSPGEHVLAFTDFGTGQRELLLKKLGAFQILVCDHHEPPGEVAGTTAGDGAFATKEGGAFLELNPHYHGIDGGREISGAGVTYVACKNLGPRNEDLAPMAVVGAVGDRQDQEDQHQLTGFNQVILEDGIKLGLVDSVYGIRVFGRETRPLAKALAYTTDPYIPGLSGNPDACSRFLVDLGLKLEDESGRPRTFSDLTRDEVIDFTSELTSFLAQHGENSLVVQELIAVNYILPREPKGSFTRDVREFGFLLNSCGRLDRAGLGVAIGMGARGAFLEEAEVAIAEYRGTLSSALDVIETNSLLQQMDHVQFFYGGGLIPEKVVGTVCSLVLGSPGTPEKVIVGLADSEEANLLKVSLRGPTTVVQDPVHNPSGVHLGEIMHEASAHFNLENPAGGHAAACGAYIPRELMDDFLRFVDERVGRKLSLVEDDAFSG